MIPDSRDYYDDIYDDHQLYEEKLSKIDGSMIALSPDGQNLAIFDPRTYGFIFLYMCRLISIPNWNFLISVGININRQCCSIKHIKKLSCFVIR